MDVRSSRSGSLSKPAVSASATLLSTGGPALIWKSAGMLSRTVNTREPPASISGIVQTGSEGKPGNSDVVVQLEPAAAWTDSTSSVLGTPVRSEPSRGESTNTKSCTADGPELVTTMV